MIFRTGSVLIVGKCEEQHIINVYNYLKGILATEYRHIYQDNGPVNVKIKAAPRTKYISIEVSNYESITESTSANDELLQQ